jgi:beta-glucosidase
MKKYCVLAVFLTVCSSPLQAEYQYPFQDPDMPTEQRIDNIISLMTLEEKITCLGTNPSVPRLGIKGSGHVEGLHGLARGGPSNWGRRNPVTTTIFPQAIGLGETWDKQLLQQIAAAEGYEARYIFQNGTYVRGSLVVRAPNADLGRDPRWGRTEECYGEDPYFNGAMTVAFVKGLQGNHPKYWLTASLLKHFLANSNEDTRESSSSDFDERLFREYYSVPFRMGIVDGGARAFMAAYNAYNGIPCTVHPMLKDITVKEWGNDGIICTDGGAFRLLITAHKLTSDPNEAAAMCIKAGINQFLDKHIVAVRAAVNNKLLAESEIDAVLRGSFRVMIKLGLLDPPDRVPYSSIGQADEPEPWTTEKHQSLARLATQKSIVLLKNKKYLLPLDKSKIKSIAVVGPRANEVLLDWYSGTPPYTITPLEGIRNKAGTGITVHFDPNATTGLVKTSDVAIVCVGNHPTCDADWAECQVPSEGKEAKDRKTITLEQEELIRKVYKANPRTVVVLISSFPYAINWTQKNVPAILHLTHCSQELGSGLADVLFGDVNPGGRLVQTWPQSMEQLPPMMDYDIRHGRTYLYSKDKPLYPFGYGLSYTTFQYSNLRTSADTLKKDGQLTVSLDIQNTGKRTGDEVVQLYVKHPNSNVRRPIQELKGFERITLSPGEKKTVSMPLQASSLAYWDIRQSRFVVEEEKIKIRLGSSSADIHAEKTVEIVK